MFAGRSDVLQPIVAITPRNALFATVLCGRQQAVGDEFRSYNLERRKRKWVIASNGPIARIIAVGKSWLDFKR